MYSLCQTLVVTKGWSRCRSLEVQEGHKKDTTSARLTSEGKSCELSTKQLNKDIWAQVRGASRGWGIMGCPEILNICVNENVVLRTPNRFCHLYCFCLMKDSASSSCSSTIDPRWTVGALWVKGWFGFDLCEIQEQNLLPTFVMISQLCSLAWNASPLSFLREKRGTDHLKDGFIVSGNFSSLEPYSGKEGFQILSSRK